MKKLLTVLLAILCMMSLTVASFAAGNLYDDSQDLTWTLENGTLTITGEGEMADKNGGEDWTQGYAADIKKIVITDGITRIGKNAFGRTLFYVYDHPINWNCENLEEVQIAEGVESIGEGAFGSATSLKTVYIPSSMKEIEVDAFGDCSAIEDVYFNGTPQQWAALKLEIAENNDCLVDAKIHFPGEDDENEKVGKVNSVSIGDISMNYKASAKIERNVNADAGVKYTVKYSSSNPSVATVDSNGNVKATGTGNATITCTVTDEYGNTVSDTCNVKVSYAWWQWIIVIVLFGWIWY